ncbi:MAG: hypothetical protein GWO12_16935 [Gemmatimonadetes bacterium]|uniref:Uncharacterized protein n=1 Tax=Candidatus Kutchimonas denitrificans TaxID=3056748 RepID=A0AAE4ZAR9_9BACT|nr:hypothetical protein [Candidatus Kutchimonas denitrificans]
MQFNIIADVPPPGYIAFGVMAHWSAEKRSLELILGRIRLSVGWFRL